MAYNYLRHILGLVFILVCMGCSTHQKRVTSSQPQTFFESELSSATLFTLSEQYLEWQRGFSITIRNPEAGLLVTDWALDSPHEREQITLKVTKQPTGSLLSTHVRREALTEAGWINLPINSHEEASLLKEIKQWTEKSASSPAKK